MFFFSPSQPKAPTTHVFSCTAEELPTKLNQCPFAPIYILAFVTPHQEAATIAALIKRHYPKSKLVLCSTAGELATTAPELYCPTPESWQTIAVQMFSPEVFASVEVLKVPLECADLKQGHINRPLHMRIEALAETIRKLTILTEIHHDDTLAYTLVDGLSSSESFFIEAAYKTNRLPCLLIGGSTGGKLDFQNTYLYEDTTDCSGHALITLLKLKPHVRYGILKSQNFELTEHTFTVMGGNLELRYVDLVRTPQGKTMSLTEHLCAHFHCFPHDLEENLKDYTLALKIGDELYVRTIQSFDFTKSRVHFYCDVAPGEQLYLVKRTDIVAQTEADFEKFMRGKPRLPFAGILNDCICRRLYNAGNLAGLTNIFKQTPTMGFSTFGELLGLNINQTLTALFFFHVKPGEFFADDYHHNFVHYYAQWSSFFISRNMRAYYSMIEDFIEQLQSYEVTRISLDKSLSKELVSAATELLGNTKPLFEIAEKLSNASFSNQKSHFTLLKNIQSIRDDLKHRT